MCDSKTKPDDLPTLEELRKGLTEQTFSSDDFERGWVRNFQKKSVTAQEKYERLKGLKDHYRHKSHWSYFLMILMAVMIGFQSYLLFKVGVGAWDFTDYSWLLPALLAQNLAQIVGLAIFVVKALFDDPK